MFHDNKHRLSVIARSTFGGVAVFLMFMTNAFSQSESANVPPEWQTVSERTAYHKTSTYDETIAYCQKLAKASSGLIIYKSYGKSGEVRDLPQIIAASDKTITPE